MIIAKTPYRVSFFGGGSDYPDWYKKNGGTVISASINKHVYITCRSLPSYFKHRYRVSYSKIEEAKKIKDIKHKVVRTILKKYKDKIKNSGLEIHYDGDFPSRSGVGSSSSFVVGLLHALNEFYNLKLNKKKLANLSIELEQKNLKETVGIQDPVAAAYGGFNEIKFFKSGKYKVNSLVKDEKELKVLQDRLFLVFTGVRKKSKTANDIAGSYVKNLSITKINEIQSIIRHAKEAKKFLKNKDYDSFGKLLGETWKKKKQISKNISNPKIDKIYKLGIKNGALGGKLLGAGGAGFLLFYVPEKKNKSFIKKFKNYTIVKFKFDKKGSEIIFNNKEKDEKFF